MTYVTFDLKPVKLRLMKKMAMIHPYQQTIKNGNIFPLHQISMRKSDFSVIHIVRYLNHTTGNSCPHVRGRRTAGHSGHLPTSTSRHDLSVLHGTVSVPYPGQYFPPCSG